MKAGDLQLLEYGELKLSDLAQIIRLSPDAGRQGLLDAAIATIAELAADELQREWDES